MACGETTWVYFLKIKKKIFFKHTKCLEKLIELNRRARYILLIFEEDTSFLGRKVRERKIFFFKFEIFGVFLFSLY